MKIGASTYYGAISQTVVDTVNELEKVGFNAIELAYEYNNFFSDQEIKALKTKKLDFSLHCPFIGMMPTHPDANFVKPQIKIIEKSLKAAVKIGCTHCVIHGGEFPKAYTMVENPKTRDFFIYLFIKRFKDLFKKYTKNGLKIVMENLSSDMRIGGKLSDIIKIQEAIPEVGFCFDMAHSEVTKQTREILEKMNIDYVHLTDNNLEIDEHKVIGKGKIDFKKIFFELKKKGFDGKFILENLSYEECRASFRNLKKIIGTLCY